MASDSKRLYFQPRNYFKDLVADINRADREIIFEVYLFELDQVGREFLKTLQAAVKRGLRIRVLIDGVGSYRDASAIADSLASVNCDVRIFHPLPWDFALYRHALESDSWYAQALHFLAAINHRDHRKLCIVDSEIAWLGSYNITADHANVKADSLNDYWHDTGLRLTGSMVRELEQNFEQVWQRKRGSRRQRSRRFLARDSVSTRSQRNLQLLQVLEAAKQRIWITNAYFNPSNRLLKILKRKAASGVDVQVIVPSRSDIVFFPMLSRTYYTDLLGANIRIFEYRHRVLHSKTVLIDDCLLVGSTNLNYRSLFHDLELDALVTDQEIVTQMQSRYLEDIKFSVEITLPGWQQDPWLSRSLGWFSRFLRNWL